MEDPDPDKPEPYRSQPSKKNIEYRSKFYLAQYRFSLTEATEITEFLWLFSVNPVSSARDKIAQKVEFPFNIWNLLIAKAFQEW